MAFRDLLDQIMDCRGITERDFEKILRERRILTDEIIFAITRYISRVRAIDIFFTRMSYTTETRIRFFGDEFIDYVFLNKEKKVCAVVSMDLHKNSLFVEYPILKQRLCIGKDLLDYDKDKKDKIMDFRMELLNEQLIRYYIKLLPTIYSCIQREYR